MSTETNGQNKANTSIDDEVIASEIRRAIEARAARLGIDPDTIGSPAPRAVTARTHAGDLLRLDVSTYRSADLDR